MHSTCGRREGRTGRRRDGRSLSLSLHDYGFIGSAYSMLCVVQREEGEEGPAIRCTKSDHQAYYTYYYTGVS